MKVTALLCLLLTSCAASRANPLVPRQRAISAIDSSTVRVHCDSGWGSGVVIGQTDTASIILTAHHVVDRCDSITVNKQQAQSVAVSYQYDLALVWIPGTHGPVAKVRKPLIGEYVTVAGYPYDDWSESAPFTVTGGIVAALIGGGQFRVDAHLSPGVSGGGVWDEDGKLIGVATHGLSDRFGMKFYCFLAALGPPLIKPET